jgi:site-specific DNA-methyltransferase (adenine-specific)
MTKIEFIQGDCLQAMNLLEPQSIDCIVTSPPYNIGVKYEIYDDTLDREAYLVWTSRWLEKAKIVLKEQGSLFLNIGCKPTNPWGPFEVAFEARKHFKLQNTIYWVKSISIENRSHGHYKPINSERFVNDCVEMILHLTKTGDVAVNRTAIGVPFMDKTNITRGTRGKNGDLRCRGNAWFVPYETTTTSKSHPAAFPVKLAEMCFKLHGVQEGMKTLDPFSGTGSSAVASKNLKADHIGIELSNKDIEEAKKRLLWA